MANKDYKMIFQEYCTWIKGKNGKYVRVVRVPVLKNIDHLYFSANIESKTEVSDLHFLGILVNAQTIYVTHANTFRSLFDCKGEDIVTIQEAFKETEKIIGEQIQAVAKGIARPNMDLQMRNEALELAYMTFVRDASPILQFAYNGYTQVDVLSIALQSEDAVKNFAKKYFEENHNSCLKNLAVYEVAMNLIETWQNNQEHIANLSRTMFQALRGKTTIAIVKIGNKTYETIAERFGNVYVDKKTGEYKISEIPVKDKSMPKRQQTVVVTKNSITELKAINGKILYEKKEQIAKT